MDVADGHAVQARTSVVSSYTLLGQHGQRCFAVALHDEPVESPGASYIEPQGQFHAEYGC